MKSNDNHSWANSKKSSGGGLSELIYKMHVKPFGNATGTRDDMRIENQTGFQNEKEAGDDELNKSIGGVSYDR